MTLSFPRIYTFNYLLFIFPFAGYPKAVSQNTNGSHHFNGSNGRQIPMQYAMLKPLFDFQ